MTDAERARERDHTENHDTNDESEDTSQVADANVPGQLIYPDRVVDAERAAAFAAGKVPTLDPDDEDSLDDDEEPLPGDETGEETEPAAQQ
jgi:hypothetical protein